VQSDDEYPVITIDGPAGSGKGTIGQALAIRLGWNFLDSGALYRACAYVAERNSISLTQASEMEAHLRDMDFTSIPAPPGSEAKVLLNGEDISEQIRTPQIAQLASKFAAKQSVRDALLYVQREYHRCPGLVADGRDMGSVVFPDGKLKIFLSASLKTRAQRKYIQLKNQGNCVNFDAIYENIASRDRRDSGRKHSPLIMPQGAMEIDSSDLSVDGVLYLILEKLKSVLNEERPI